MHKKQKHTVQLFHIAQNKAAESPPGALRRFHNYFMFLAAN